MLSMLYDPRERVDKAAVKAAIETLGIRHPVEIHISGTRLLGPAGTAGPSSIPTGWEVRIAADLPIDEEARKAGPPETELSVVLWHELGHLQDYERHGLTPITQPEWFFREVRPRYTVAFGRQQNYPDFKDWMRQEYDKIPAEHYANEVARKHAPDHPLSRRV